jgi:RNA polymerase sigma factor (sigma-70 family)
MTTQLSKLIQCVRSTANLHGAGEMTDGQLLESFVDRREEAALEVLVRRHGPMVWGVCRRILHNHHDAEDAFQATFLVLVRKAGSIVPRGMVGNWLYGVAHQTALKARTTTAKRRARERQVTDMPEPLGKEPDLSHHLQSVLDHELSRLPDKYRVAIVLCDLEGKTRKEAARQLGCPEGTLAARLVRGRVKLAKRLSKPGTVLSGGTLAAVMPQTAASAGVPATLLSSTIKALALYATGQAKAGVVSANALALTQGVLKSMLLSKLRIAPLCLLVSLIVSLIVLGGELFTGHPAMAKQGNAETAQEDLPAERGSFAAVKSSAVVWRGSAPNAAIKWIIADGTKVKKGDKLVEIEDAYYGELLNKQQTVVAKAEGDHKRAAENLARIKEENQIDVKIAQIDVRLAHLALKEFKGQDAAAKEVLELKLDRAGLLVDRIKLKGAAKESEAAADLAAKKAVLDAKVGRQRAIEKERSNCVLTAPQDGMAVLNLPDSGQKVVAVGDGVYDGKRLMVVSDLTQMAFQAHIPENLISKVRQGQKATIRVDAFPKRAFTGTVHKIAEKADRLGKLRVYYNVTILVDGVNDILLPGMSGEVTIQTAGKAKSP